MCVRPQQRIFHLEGNGPLIYQQKRPATVAAMTGMVFE